MKKLFKEILRPTPELELAGNVSQIVRLGLVLLVVFFGGVGGWMAFVPMASAITTSGVVKVVNDAQVIQHHNGGIVKRIWVNDGDKVHRAQPLIEFEDARVSAADTSLSVLVDAEVARVARLQAEQWRADHIDFPASLMQRKAQPSVAAAMEREQTLFAQRRQSYRDQKRQLELERTQLNEEINSGKQQEESVRKAYRLLQSQIAAYRNLLDKQYIARTQFEDLLRTEQDYLVRISALEGQLAQTRQRLADINLRLQGLQDGLAQSIDTDLQETALRQAETLQQYLPANDAAERLILRSPIDGVIFNQRVNTIGEVIGPGVVLMQVIPENPQFVVEASVPVQEIRHVSVGRIAELRFTAFSHRSSPYVPGKVIYVSPDRVVNPGSTQPPSYLIRIAVNSEEMQKKWGMKLSAGMPAEVFIRGASRTILSYLIEPVTDSMAHAMREP